MMIRRDRAVRGWGWADGGEQARVKVAGRSAAMTADRRGNRALELPPMAAGQGLEPKVANLYNREGLPASPFRTDDW